MVVTTAISSVVSAVRSPFAGNSPTAPVELAVAVDDDGCRAAGVRPDARAQQTGQPGDDIRCRRSASASTLAVADARHQRRRHPADGAAGAACSYLPIIGPMFVTPVVAFIHQIPVVGDVLHPFIGYPVQLGWQQAPVPRDVKVISSDGTPIYVHFLPGAGLAAAGGAAPTILDGPGLALPGETSPTIRSMTRSCRTTSSASAHC